MGISHTLFVFHSESSSKPFFWGVVSHTCNYNWGGRNRRSQSSGPAWATSQDPVSKQQTQTWILRLKIILVTSNWGNFNLMSFMRAFDPCGCDSSHLIFAKGPRGLVGVVSKLIWYVPRNGFCDDWGECMDSFWRNLLVSMCLYFGTLSSHCGHFLFVGKQCTVYHGLGIQQ